MKEHDKRQEKNRRIADLPLHAQWYITYTNILRNENPEGLERAVCRTLRTREKRKLKTPERSKLAEYLVWERHEAKQ